MPQLFAAAAAVAAITLSHALTNPPPQAPPQLLAQPSCTAAGALAGTIRDTTAALIPGASLFFDGTLSAVSDSAGRFRLPCVAPGRHTLTATADGFAPRTLAVTAPHPGPTDLILPPETVETVAADGKSTRSQPLRGTLEDNLRPFLAAAHTFKPTLGSPHMTAHPVMCGGLFPLFDHPKDGPKDGPKTGCPMSRS